MDKALLLSGFATFMLVFLRGFQQKNVHGNHYFMAAITSTAMSVTDIAVVSFVIHHGWAVLPYTATGATLGIISSMWLHSRVVGKMKGQGLPDISVFAKMPPVDKPKQQCCGCEHFMAVSDSELRGCRCECHEKRIDTRQSCCGCESPNVTMEKGACQCICHL